MSADIQVVTWLSATVYNGFFETRGERVSSIHAALGLKRIADHTCNQNCVWRSSVFRHWANLLEPTSRNCEKCCNCKYIQATSQDIFVWTFIFFIGCMTFYKHLYRALAFGSGHVTALKYCLIIIIIIINIRRSRNGVLIRERLTKWLLYCIVTESS